MKTRRTAEAVFIAVILALSALSSIVGVVIAILCFLKG